VIAEFAGEGPGRTHGLIGTSVKHPPGPPTYQ
jgi:hypothetical protein